jgi:hypothetical protein
MTYTQRQQRRATYKRDLQPNIRNTAGDKQQSNIKHYKDRNNCSLANNYTLTSGTVRSSHSHKHTHGTKSRLISLIIIVKTAASLQELHVKRLMMAILGPKVK